MAALKRTKILGCPIVAQYFCDFFFFFCLNKVKRSLFCGGGPTDQQTNRQTHRLTKTRFLEILKAAE